MTSTEILSLCGSLLAVIVAFTLSSRGQRDNRTDQRVTALEIGMAALQATVITRLDSIDKKVDALSAKDSCAE